MPRPKPLEEMVIRSVYGPARLLNRPGLSEYLVSLAEKDYVGTKPTDPRLATVQTVISEYVSEHPGIKREYQIDDIIAERKLNQELAIKGLQATASEIGEIMTKLIKERV